MELKTRDLVHKKIVLTIKATIDVDEVLQEASDNLLDDIDIALGDVGSMSTPEIISAEIVDKTPEEMEHRLNYDHNPEPDDDLPDNAQPSRLYVEPARPSFSHPYGINPATNKPITPWGVQKPAQANNNVQVLEEGV
jgi:hypothetical protein